MCREVRVVIVKSREAVGKAAIKAVVVEMLPAVAVCKIRWHGRKRILAVCHDVNMNANWQCEKGGVNAWREFSNGMFVKVKSEGT